MTIVDFCRSEYGRGISQSRLYRKLRRYVETEDIERPAIGDLWEYQDYGFTVVRDTSDRLNYQINEPERFRTFALNLTAGPVVLSQRNLDAIAHKLQDYVNIYERKDKDAVMGHRGTGKILTGYEAYFDEVKRLIEAVREAQGETKN